MNTNLLTIVKQIIDGNGEEVLADPARLKAFFSDLAKDEPKPLRIAFGRCIEAGAYTALKTAPDATERAERKGLIAQKVREEQGLDIGLCNEALDILEAALFGLTGSVEQSEPQKTVKMDAPTAVTPETGQGRAVPSSDPLNVQKPKKRLLWRRSALLEMSIWLGVVVLVVCSLIIFLLMMISGGEL